jgi:hypothetical protein
MQKFVQFLLLALLPFALFGQENTNKSKFRQLYQELPTPNVYRNAAGAPGHAYWQQRADYQIDLKLDDANQKISGKETVTYFNQSPDALTYLWLQLDQNKRAKESDSYKIQTGKITDKTSSWTLGRLFNDFDGGFNIESVTDGSGRSLPFTINKTMMRVDLPEPVKPGGQFVFRVEWWYNINDRGKIGGRSGYEYFPEEDNYLYTIAQFYPRMAVYSDDEGWKHKQFLGSGEFTLPFGDFTVSITVPDDHIVTASGELQNEKEVLSATHRKRLEEARKTTDKPVFIVTPEEALENEAEKSGGTKTWKFRALNVRDFAFASSRKFIWDAMAVPFGDRTVMAMSVYPKEGNPLWEKYSTKVVAHTLRTYSKYTFDYPYPVAISVHTNRIGMEYPMICFNGGRPEADGTYSEGTKYGMIGVIIHEVGHNYFPMIVNSDERQWTWMDEGLNTFLQYLTEQEWERGYPSRRGPAYKIVDYMKGDISNISPIMTNSESVKQFGNNAYGKPATALNILRETVMGRELFDFAFKEYANRWMFKHPSPADFFRTMEDASGVDLDWFWRGWFFTTDHVDISLDNVIWYQLDTGDPDIEKPLAEKRESEKPRFIGDIRNEDAITQTMDEKDPSLADFYSDLNPFEVTLLDRREYEQKMSRYSEQEREWMKAGYHFYELDFSNVGGLVMPIILEFEFADGSRQVERLPAEIWLDNEAEVSKIFVFEKELRSVVLDPFLELADTDVSNNYWPPRPQPTRFQLFKGGNPRYQNDSWENPMQRAKRLKEIESRGEN